MKALSWSAWAAAVVSLVVAGCDSAPGRPKPGPEVPRPEAVLDFPTLYRQNCSGCHGAEGSNGPSYPLANPEYQAWVSDDALRQTIAQGEPGTMMPAFAIQDGGTLTDEQVNVLVSGMRAAWGKPGSSSPGAPPYQSALAGNAANGAAVYAAYCARCHGPAAQPGGTAGSILDPNLLALASDRMLRTVIVAGRPDIGQPDWRGDLAGRPLTGQQVSDVVAWLRSQAPMTAPGNGQAPVETKSAQETKNPLQKTSESGGGL
ncbi:MAG TPA: c-type cytochrome [Acidobacteriaceae bacterium]|jgi:cytochrome c oxidase cbb3-type subunit 3/ubiquinol-cytochrome c reductase cytochrome c subunit|nr:c-type cytochrome [Acidobacteriaceae bacterium]